MFSTENDRIGKETVVIHRLWYVIITKPGTKDEVSHTLNRFSTYAVENGGNHNGSREAVENRRRSLVLDIGVKAL